MEEGTRVTDRKNADERRRILVSRLQEGENIISRKMIHASFNSRFELFVLATLKDFVNCLDVRQFCPGTEPAQKASLYRGKYSFHSSVCVAHTHKRERQEKEIRLAVSNLELLTS